MSEHSTDGESIAAEEQTKGELAQEIYLELKAIQEDPIKAKITNQAVGSVFFPEGEGGVRVVNVSKFSVRGSDEIDLWTKRGLTEDDWKDGLVRVSEGVLKDPDEIYKTTSRGDMVTDQWLTSTGRLIRNSGVKEWTDAVETHTPWEGTKFTESTWIGEKWPDGESTPHTREALRRLDRLFQIPFELKTHFGTYQTFKDKLSNDVDTNGLDHFSGGELDKPWLPFYRAGDLLPWYVENAQPSRIPLPIPKT